MNMSDTAKSKDFSFKKNRFWHWKNLLYKSVKCYNECVDMIFLDQDFLICNTVRVHFRVHGDKKWVTSMLVTNVGDPMCWWQVLDVGDRFNTLRKSPSLRKKVASIMILPPTSQISHHHKVTNIPMSPTSLSPLPLFLSRKRYFLTI